MKKINKKVSSNSLRNRLAKTRLGLVKNSSPLGARYFFNKISKRHKNFFFSKENLNLNKNLNFREIINVKKKEKGSM